MREIEQALCHPHLSGQSRWGQSAEFRDEWRDIVEEMISQYGELPPLEEPAEALFVQPFGDDHIAVVRVIPSARYHCLILGKELYSFIGDPFLIAEHFPVDWDATGELPSLIWPDEPLPRRTVAELQTVLREGEGPFLLGATQLLVDGGRLLIRGDQPDPKIIRDIWSLLPTHSRAEIWPATFLPYLDSLNFHVAVMRELPTPLPDGFLSEDQVLDYPDSRYERNLQIAIEADDQVSLDRLLARRTSTQAMKLAIYILFLMMFLAVAMTIINKIPVK